MLLRKLSFLLLAITFTWTGALAECTQEEAFNKMMALGVAKGDVQKRMNSLPAGPEKNKTMKTWADLSTEISGVGKVLAAKDYPKACAEYDKIAAKYAIDLEEVSKRAPNMASLKKQ